MMAALISSSSVIPVRPENVKKVDAKWDEGEKAFMRFHEHFRRNLGDDIDEELPRRLRKHVSLLLKQSAIEARKKQESLAGLSDGESTQHPIEKEKFKLVAEDEDYQWNLAQLRVFVASCSKLDGYLAVRRRLISPGMNILQLAERVTVRRYPIVCDDRIDLSTSHFVDFESSILFW